MRQRALQIVPYAGHVTQILRLAVAPVEPREDAENLAGALRRERNVKRDELSAVEVRLGGAPPAQIAAKQRELDRFGNVDAGVLQQRGEVVGGRPHEGILEVQDADAGDAGSFG